MNVEFLIGVFITISLSLLSAVSTLLATLLYGTDEQVILLGCAWCLLFFMLTQMEDHKWSKR